MARGKQSTATTVLIILSDPTQDAEWIHSNMTGSAVSAVAEAAAKDTELFRHI